MSDLQQKILALAGKPAPEIASILGCSPRYTRRILQRHGKAFPRGARPGKDNSSWKGGRMVDLDGYVLLQTRTRVLEHRVVMEEHLGRPLTTEEVVDHRNGITIHNDLENLRLFASNGEHLRQTATGPRKWSHSGRERLKKRGPQYANLPRVDIYRQRKERGDVRRLAILRAALELDIEHPCLLGTRHWLEQAGIDPYSRRDLERGYRELRQRWQQDLLR